MSNKVVLEEGEGKSVPKAVYKPEELESMTPLRKEIANLTLEEWCMRWNIHTKKIREKYKVVKEAETQKEQERNWFNK